MSSTHNALLVFGSGPGIGRNVATLFAERGFRKVLLMSRDKQRLAQDAHLVRSAGAGVDVQAITVDAADTDSVRQALEKADEALGGTPLEFVLFNTARTGPSKFFDFSAEELEADLRVCEVTTTEICNCGLTDSIDLHCQPVHGRQMGNAKAPRPGKLQR
jgi:NAD(P)-dependent dehydrogenase (short-subunit alcohol dehydrogenase family)